MSYTSLTLYLPSKKIPRRVFYRDVLKELEETKENYIVIIRYFPSIEKLEILSKDLTSRLIKMLENLKKIFSPIISTIVTLEMLEQNNEWLVSKLHVEASSNIIVEEVSEAIFLLGIHVPIHKLVFYKVGSIHGLFINYPKEYSRKVSEIIEPLEYYKIDVDRVYVSL